MCYLFKEHEVEKMFTLKSGRLPSADVKNIIFFVRPRLELMDIIAENVFRSVWCTVPRIKILKALTDKANHTYPHKSSVF